MILDWVPGHFPTDDFALAEFDGTNLYEHSDPREGYHQDWNTLIYNYGRREVSNFLVGNALYWIERFGIDALRVDAVASMIYRDYSRKEGEWIPNEFGGRENLEAIEFLRNTNRILGEQVSGAVTMAEESTDFPGVSRPQDMGGLGFWYKWNLGWMHDTLDYMKLDPVYRQYHHDKLTFGILYNYTENFVLPLSHDEVVHGKKSILDRMPGDRLGQLQIPVAELVPGELIQNACGDILACGGMEQSGRPLKPEALLPAVAACTPAIRTASLYPSDG